MTDNKKYEYYFKCKITGKEFRFIRNTLLILKHLKENYSDLKIPSGRQRNKIMKLTDLPWWVNYFEIISKTEIVSVNCKICNWVGSELIGQNRSLGIHLKLTHKISSLEYIIKFPETKDYFNKAKLKLDRDESFKIEDKDYVVCKVCNEKFKSISNTHLEKHGLTILEYKEKYDNNVVNSTNTSDKYRILYDKNLRHYEHKKLSKTQFDIYNMLKDMVGIIKLNDRTLLDGLEIDIYLPDLNLGIELNGCFFHTEIGGKKGRLYHLEKTRLAKKSGVNLIHIFEDEWMFNKELLFKKIKHICGINDDLLKIHARKCIIKPIEKLVSNKFLNDNHIQGEDKGNIRYGAYYNDLLIAVMTFDNKRVVNQGNEKSNTTPVLNRFCVDRNYSISGIANKLLKQFIIDYNPIRIISFADRRWTLDENNNLYTKLGFKLEKTLKPNYTYFNQKKVRYTRLTKYQFGKNKLEKMFPDIYQEYLSEWDIMQLAGYDRIWDCGLFRYVLEIKRD